MTAADIQSALDALVERDAVTPDSLTYVTPLSACRSVEIVVMLLEEIERDASKMRVLYRWALRVVLGALRAWQREFCFG